MAEEGGEGIIATLLKLAVKNKIGNGQVIDGIFSKLNTLGLFPILKTQAPKTESAKIDEKPIEQPKPKEETEIDRLRKAGWIKTYG